MVNRALWALSLVSLCVFMWMWHPAVWLNLAVGFGLLANIRERNQRAADVNADALLPQPRLPDPGRAPERIA